jgi:hypothetical protein
MTSRRRRILTVIAVVTGIPALLGAMAFGCNEAVDDFWEGMCGNDVLHEHVSPDGNLKVVVFQRDCGATTGFSTQASLLRAKKKLPSGPGNIFVAISPPGVPRGPGGGPKLDVRWVSPQHVVLSHHQNAVVNQAQTQLSRVRIDYERY